MTENHLNPDQSGWDFRHIFGTATEFDQHYNTPRQWYAQRLLNPEIEQSPEDLDLPFIRHASRKISLEDVESILSSHYNGTQFDPLGHGSEADKRRYRPISLSRTQNSHVLQVRNDAPAQASAILWLCFGIPAFTPYVPFFGNSTETDESYHNTPMELNIDLKSAYWMYRTLSMLVESHHAKFIQSDLDYLKDSRQYHYNFIAETINKARDLSGTQLTEFLTSQNKVMTNEMATRTKKLIEQLIMHGLQLSELTFTMDKNL